MEYFSERALIAGTNQGKRIIPGLFCSHQFARLRMVIRIVWGIMSREGLSGAVLYLDRLTLTKWGESLNLSEVLSLCQLSGAKPPSLR